MDEETDRSSATLKPEAGGHVPTSVALFFAVPVILAFILLVIVLLCWCMLKRRSESRSRQWQPEQRRKALVVVSSKRPNSSVRFLIEPKSTESIFSCAKTHDISERELYRSQKHITHASPAAATDLAGALLNGRLLAKLIKAFPGRQQQHQLLTSSNDDCEVTESRTARVSQHQSAEEKSAGDEISMA